jgi:hypothetical protein
MVAVSTLRPPEAITLPTRPAKGPGRAHKEASFRARPLSAHEPEQDARPITRAGDADAGSPMCRWRARIFGAGQGASTSGPSSRRITPMAAFARRGAPEFNGLPRKASYCSSAGLESASRSTMRIVRGARSRDRAPPHSAASSAQSRLLLLRAVNQSLRFPVDTTRTVSKRGNPFWLHDPSGLRSSTPATLTSTVE